MNPTTSVVLGVLVLLGAYVVDLKALVKHLINVPADIKHNDKRIRNRDHDLATWIGDDARALEVDYQQKLGQANAQGLLNSGFPMLCHRTLTGHALQRYRDQLCDAERLVEEVRVAERCTHAVWRWIRRNPIPDLQAPAFRADVIARWEQAQERPDQEQAAA